MNWGTADFRIKANKQAGKKRWETALERDEKHEDVDESTCPSDQNQNKPGAQMHAVGVSAVDTMEVLQLHAHVLAREAGDVGAHVAQVAVQHAPPAHRHDNHGAEV